jgi:hypothetical protein
VAELADALDSGSSRCKPVWVQVPSSAFAISGVHVTPSSSKVAGTSPSRPPCGLKGFALCSIPRILCSNTLAYTLFFSSFGVLLHVLRYRQHLGSLDITFLQFDEGFVCFLKLERLYFGFYGNFCRELQKFPNIPACDVCHTFYLLLEP